MSRTAHPGSGPGPNTAPIPKGVRYQVLRRDNFACRYCGRPAPEVRLEVDHVTPRVDGGTNEPSNLVTACEDCNRGKAATTPGTELVADVLMRDLREASRRETSAQLRGEALETFDLAWTRVWWQMPGDDCAPAERIYGTRPIGWEEDVLGFVAAGVDVGYMSRIIGGYVRNYAPGPADLWPEMVKWCRREIERLRQVHLELLEVDR